MVFFLVVLDATGASQYVSSFLFYQCSSLICNYPMADFFGVPFKHVGFSLMFFPAPCTLLSLSDSHPQHGGASANAGK